MKDKKTILLKDAKPGMFLKTSGGYLMECISIEGETGLFKPHDRDNGFGHNADGLCPFGTYHEWELISEGREP